jgi:hypothetical protein
MVMQFLSGYYEKVMQLATIISQPGTPEPVVDLAKKIAVAVSALVERTLRTFDQIRDVSTFVVDAEAQIDAAGKGVDPNVTNQLLQIVAQLGNQAQANGLGGGLGGGAQ